MNNFKYYITNKYSENSLLIQYLELTSIIFENYNYNINNKTTCHYIIDWEYTSGCTILGEIPNYFKNEEILDLIKNYYKNSELTIVEKLNSNFTTLDIYCYEINITHYLELDDDNNINNQFSLDGSANEIYTLDNNYIVNPSIIHEYFFKRSKNKDNLGELEYRLENITDNSEFPLFYYDNNISNKYNSKYQYNVALSNYFINGNKKIYNKNDLIIREQFVFNYYYYTSILVIIDKNKFGEISINQDILNTTEFGLSLIDNFQSFYENGIIKIKSNNNDKIFQLDNDDLIYENNIILCFIIPNDNIISINNINENNDSLLEISKNYNINFRQTDNNLKFINKKNVNINYFINKKGMKSIIDNYPYNDNLSEIDQSERNNYFLNYRIQRFTNINQKNYNYVLGFPIQFTLEIDILKDSKFIPDYINILYFDNYKKEVNYVNDPSTLSSTPSKWNINFTSIDNIYTINFDNNYIFPWSDILIIIFSKDLLN